MVVRTSTSCSTAPTLSSVATSPSSPGPRPSAPRWSTASTGAARWLRSTDLLPACGQLKSPGFGRGFFVAPSSAVRLADLTGFAFDRKLPSPSRAGFQSPSVTCGADKAPGDEGKCHAQSVADRWPARASHGPALDWSGPGRDQLAAIELHDQTDPVGRLRRGAGRARPDPDLAEQAVALESVGWAKAHSSRRAHHLQANI